MSCYAKQNGTVAPLASSTPCSASSSSSSSASSCCREGDMCLSSGFCMSTSISPEQSGSSGYYLGGCTDASYNSPACPAQCADQAYPDAIFDYGAGEWRCCGGDSTNGIQCARPTGPSFHAPLPAELHRSSSSFMGSGNGSFEGGHHRHHHHGTDRDGFHSGNHTQSSSGSPSASDAADAGGLSKPDLVAISIGASVAILLVLGVVAFCLVQVRRRRRAHPFRRGTEPTLLPPSMRDSEPQLFSEVQWMVPPASSSSSAGTAPAKQHASTVRYSGFLHRAPGSSTESNGGGGGSSRSSSRRASSARSTDRLLGPRGSRNSHANRSVRSVSTYVSDNGDAPWPLALETSARPAQSWDSPHARAMLRQAHHRQSGTSARSDRSETSDRTVSTWSSFSSGSGSHRFGSGGDDEDNEHDAADGCSDASRGRGRALKAPSEPLTIDLPPHIYEMGAQESRTPRELAGTEVLPLRRPALVRTPSASE